MTRCCSTLQWFSMDMMTGYADTWTGQGQRGVTQHCGSVIVGETNTNVHLWAAAARMGAADGWSRGQRDKI